MENHAIRYYQLSVDETLVRLKTQKHGLDTKELEQRLKIYGPNKFSAGKKEFFILKMLRQFKDLMIIMLLVAGSLSLYFDDYRSAVILYTIVVINVLIGFFQEYKAEKVMESLKVLIQARAKVIRGDKVVEVDQADLVPGDIVILEEGDAVPADLRVMEEQNLATNDFALTGESNPCRKFTHPIPGTVQIGDRNNIVFMGTTVATGNGKGIVIATAMHTEVGHIATLTQATSTDLSPLQNELNSLAKSITGITLVIAAALFVIALLVHFTINEAFIFAVGVASAMVPEGLPAQVNIALSLAAARLAKNKTIIKKLSAVETLGATHIICTDKTGTLTKNEMTVQKILIGKKEFVVSGLGYKPEGNVQDSEGVPLSKEALSSYQLFFETGIFASNARVSAPDKEHPVWYSIGDPTESALITLGQKVGLDPVHMDKQYPEIKEFCFDSVRKRMTSIRTKEGKTVAYIKGSPQSVLERCSHIWDGVEVRAITDADRAHIIAKDDEYATQALRNLAYAYRELPHYSDSMSMDETEQDLIFLGLASMIDPPREDVEEAMQAALKAHIRVIIITGDYALTAIAIAKKVGLSGDNSTEITVVNGAELQKMSDIDLVNKFQATNLVFARTSPEDKLRIVKLLKKAGAIVAVTGDGVNDAPALKKADIGVAMGKTGTDVAKNSAEIVLLDDSFATLVRAIKEGRTIFHNLTKTIINNMCGNSSELFVILISLLGAAIFGFPLAILTYQILAIDLVGAMLPVTALTWDQPHARVMSEKPRNPQKHVLNKATMLDFLWSGLIVAIIAYSNFFSVFLRAGQLPLNIHADDLLYWRATTLTYVTIVLILWINLLSRRVGDHESIFTAYLWSNKRLLLSFGLSLFFVLNIVYNPHISQWLSTAPLNTLDWLYAIGASFVFLAIHEIRKAIRRKKVPLLVP